MNPKRISKHKRVMVVLLLLALGVNWESLLGVTCKYGCTQGIAWNFGFTYTGCRVYERTTCKQAYTDGTPIANSECTILSNGGSSTVIGVMHCNVALCSHLCPFPSVATDYPAYTDDPQLTVCDQRTTEARGACIPLPTGSYSGWLCGWL